MTAVNMRKEFSLLKWKRPPQLAFNLGALRPPLADKSGTAAIYRRRF